MSKEKQLSLYLVTIKTSNPHYKRCYVAAANAQEAYDKYREFLEQMDVLFEPEREMESIHLLGKVFNQENVSREIALFLM